MVEPQTEYGNRAKTSDTRRRGGETTSKERTGPLPSTISAVASILRSAPRPAEKQRQDSVLGTMYSEVIQGGGERVGEGSYLGGNCVLLWNAPKYAPKREVSNFPIPHTLVPGVLASVHST